MAVASIRMLVASTAEPVISGVGVAALGFVFGLSTYARQRKRDARQDALEAAQRDAKEAQDAIARRLDQLELHEREAAEVRLAFERDRVDGR